MNDRPLITMVVLAYNQERFVDKAIEGALAQTYEPLEIILSDDFSTDRTYEIIQRAARQYHGAHTVRVNRNDHNLGLAGHLNRVVEISSGELIVMAAGDDISLPWRVSRIVTAWEEKGCASVCLHSRARVMLPDGTMTGHVAGPHNCHGLSSARSLIRNGAWMLGATEACPKKQFEIFGNFTTSFFGEDVVLSFRSALLGGAIYIPEPLVDYRISAGMSTQDTRKLSRQEQIALALRRIESSMACTEQMERDLRTWGGGDAQLRRLLRVRRGVSECVRASYVKRGRALFLAVRLMLEVEMYRSSSWQRAVIKAIWRVLSGHN